MCCGQKRADLRRNSVPGTAPAVPQNVSGGSRTQPGRIQTPDNQSINRQTGSPSISIRYVETSRIRVRGPFTGLQYDFSGAHSVQAVDARDAESLLSTRFFRRAATT